MRIDELVAHFDDIGEVVGDFHGTPIRTLASIDAEVRETQDAQFRTRMSLGIASAPIELLPGEVITGNTVRRSTSAEVVGEAFYEKKIPSGEKIDIVLAQCAQKGALITWRPNNENFAVIHEEVASELPA